MGGPQRSGLARQHVQVMDRMVAAEAAQVLGTTSPVLADDDPVGVGVDPTGRPTVIAMTEYLLLSKCTRQIFDTDAGRA